MARRTFAIVTVFSMAMLAGSVLLFLAGYVLSPWDHYLSFGDDFHVGVWGHSLDSRIVFFNDAEYGPYRGSITKIVGVDRNVYPPLEREETFRDSWGIYYRYFQWSDSKLWTLMVTLWYPVAVSATIAALGYAALLACRLRARNRCLSGELDPPVTRS